jgi:sialate O-acetylesterase
VSFANAGSGLRIEGREVRNLLVAGADHRFVPAQGKVVGTTLVVWSPQVKDPVAVRYAFSSDATLNVWSLDGLPVAPFRTDSW